MGEGDEGLPSAMKVTHHNDAHLLCLSSEEVALLIDLCHAGAFSDELVQDDASRNRLERFLGEMQSSLYGTAQRVWRGQLGQSGGHGPARQRPAAGPPAVDPSSAASASHP